MARSKPRKRAMQKDEVAEKYLADAAKRGELNPKHRSEFEDLLDQVIQPVKARKKKKK